MALDGFLPSGNPRWNDRHRMVHKRLSDHLVSLGAAADRAGVLDCGKTLTLSTGEATDNSSADCESYASPAEEYPEAARKAIHPQLGTERPFEVILGEHIGSGGMADVDSAIQISLSREVVIKRVKRGLHSEANCDALRREAFIMGQLEHPNIPPVYEIAYIDDAPLVIMKRIYGTSWECTGRPGNRESLLADLQILIQISRAIEYAQSKGIIHRDIKPANVMIGDFGEVYLLDWGCAVKLDRSGNLYSTGFQGTPIYAAPEMVESSEPLTHQTDVYLLGATLHHILTGHGPHMGQSFFDTVIAALESPEHIYDKEIDAELAAIANRATSRQPASRFGTATGFRKAIEEYVRYFHFHDLLNSAVESCQTLRNTLEAPEGNFFSFYQRAFTGRFACQQVLEIRPENEEAHRINTEILMLLATHEIRLMHLTTARELIKQIHSLPHDKAELLKLEQLYCEQENKHQRADEMSTQIQYKLLEKLQNPDLQN